ncbi:MAG TPA: hypothetical protein VF941_03110 [Clostridia bacterium]
MSDIIDQKLLVVAAGLILGFLESQGIANPAQHTQNLNEINQFLGAFITCITIASYFIHLAVVQHAKIKYGTPQSPTTPVINQPSLFSRLAAKIFVQSNPMPSQTAPQGGGDNVQQEKVSA